MKSQWQFITLKNLDTDEANELRFNTCDYIIDTKTLLIWPKELYIKIMEKNNK